MKVLSDTLDAADSRQVTLLGLLDLSATFDTVYHDILLVHLETSFGISGYVPLLVCLKLFLSDRQQAVSLNGVTSALRSVMCSVPQGSVLRPLLFILYTADVVLIAQRHHVAVHSYADNTQLYASCSATDGLTSAAQLLRCITDIVDWMTSNRLTLNAKKTQFIWLSLSHYTASVSHLPLSVGGSTVFPDDTVLNLGMTFDVQLTVRNHVDMMPSCFFQLHQLCSVR